MADNNVMKYIGWSALVAVIVGFIVLVVTYDTTFNDVDLESFPNTVSTDRVPAFIDTVAHVALDESDIKGVSVNIYPLPSAMANSDELKLDAYVIDGVEPDSYSIYIKTDVNKPEAIAILSHEIIHVKQRDDRRLIMNESFAIFEGDTIGFSSTPYLMRPWEQEAFAKGPILEEEIKDRLYN